jgi:hypothetical protein
MATGVGNLFAQQCLVALTKPVERLLDRVLDHAEFRRDLCLRHTVRFVHEHFLHLIKEPHIPGAAILFAQSRHHLLQHRKGPMSSVDLIGREPIAVFRLNALSLLHIVKPNQPRVALI